MTASLDERLAAIQQAPKGPEVAAFFDYDGTVIGGYSAGAFYRERIRTLDMGVPELLRTVLAGLRGIDTAEEFEEFLDLTLHAWQGRTEQEMDELGRRLFTEEIAAQLHTEVWQLVQAHRDQGHTVVLASSATRFQVDPMARELDADHVLCTPIEIADGVVTGRTGGPSLWGPRKATAARELAEQHGIRLDDSFGYANGSEDVPFLSLVGNPTAVAPTGTLRAEAEQRGWPVLECTPRGGMLPSVGDVARTVGFYAGMAGAFGTAAGIGLLRGSRRQIVDLTSSVGADVGLALAGIDVEVQGTEHLWSARPCVFVFNHQSKFDIPVIMKLLRSGYTGVAKKEAKNIPGWGQMFQIADVAFIDRGNTRQAKDALAPAVRKITDEGMSLGIAPEGTRSATPRVGPFKKGAFHIAMQAGVPVVPIVIRNAGEVMWRGAQTLRPGTVQVCVLPPVDTTGWRVKDLDQRVAEVRSAFVDTLAHWPGGVAHTAQ